MSRKQRARANGVLPTAKAVKDTDNSDEMTHFRLTDAHGDPNVVLSPQSTWLYGEPSRTVEYFVDGMSYKALRKGNH